MSGSKRGMVIGCTPAQLIATKAENATSRKTATADAGVIELPATLRPKGLASILSHDRHAPHL